MTPIAFLVHNFLTYEAFKPNTYQEISQYRLLKENKDYSKIQII